MGCYIIFLSCDVTIYVTQAPPLYRLSITQIKGEWVSTGSQRSDQTLCCYDAELQRTDDEDETDISAPELIQHMLVLEDGLSRPDTSQRSRLWRRLLVAVLCGALVVTIVSDLTLLVRGDLPAETILGGNSSTTQ